MPLTYGIEFEFLLATLPDTIPDPDPTYPGQIHGIIPTDTLPYIPPVPSPDPSILTPSNTSLDPDLDEVQSHLASTLRSHSIPSITEAAERRRVEILKEKWADWEKDEYSKWFVGTDSSIIFPMEDDEEALALGYRWHRIELKTPILMVGNEKDWWTVVKVLKVLREKYRVHTNRSCGLHVHVGDGTNGFRDDVVRWLMALLFGFEDRFDTIHPQHRNENPICLGLGQHTNLGLMMNPNTKRQFTRMQMVDKILRARDTDEVISLLRVRSMTGLESVRIMRLGSRFATCRNRKTVEFRRHEGTVDEERVCMWVGLCVGVVDAAVRCAEGDGGLRNLVRRCEDWRMGLGDLLGALGMSDLGMYYE